MINTCSNCGANVHDGIGIQLMKGGSEIIGKFCDYHCFNRKALTYTSGDGGLLTICDDGDKEIKSHG